MARITFMAGDEFALKLSMLATNSEDIAKKAIEAGANPIADAIRANLKGVLSLEATGELLDSFGITPVMKDDNGNWNAKIGFDGYDSHNVPNQLKARALESGTSTQPKRPFVRPAIRSTKAKSLKAMEDTGNSEIAKIMK